MVVVVEVAVEVVVMAVLCHATATATTSTIANSTMARGNGGTGGDSFRPFTLPTAAVRCTRCTRCTRRRAGSHCHNHPQRSPTTRRRRRRPTTNTHPCPNGTAHAAVDNVDAGTDAHAPCHRHPSRTRRRVVWQHSAQQTAAAVIRRCVAL